MTLSDSLREKLKSPLGDLILDDLVDKESLKKLTADKYIISVGDRTTEKMIKYGLIPSLQIVDNQERRQSRKAPDMSNISEHLECVNPAAEITQQSIDTIKTAFSLVPPVRITIHGEEDLLVIPACIYAPDNAVVLYGQPGQGLVIVFITTEIRNKTQSLLHMINGV